MNTQTRGSEIARQAAQARWNRAKASPSAK